VVDAGSVRTGAHSLTGSIQAANCASASSMISTTPSHSETGNGVNRNIAKK
jgi:hypothetical protein